MNNTKNLENRHVFNLFSLHTETVYYQKIKKDSSIRLIIQTNSLYKCENKHNVNIYSFSYENNI